MTQTVETYDERVKVESWRLHVLVEAGYPVPLAERVAHSNADLHQAVGLVRAGCSPRSRRRDLDLGEIVPYRWPSMKVEAIGAPAHPARLHPCRAFNPRRGLVLERLPTVWVEGEICDLRRQERWQSVFFHAEGRERRVDSSPASCLAGQFDGLRLDLQDGERVHVYGRPELFEPRGELPAAGAQGDRALRLGEHWRRCERLKQKLAAEGLFAPERKRPPPPSRAESAP